MFQKRCYICKFESCRKFWWTDSFFELTAYLFSKKFCIFYQNFEGNIGILDSFLSTQSSDFFEYSICIDLWKIKLENLCEEFRMLLMVGWFLYFIIASKAGWLDSLSFRSLSQLIVRNFKISYNIWEKIIESFWHFIFIRLYILVIDQSNSFSRFDFIRKERFNGVPKISIYRWYPSHLILQNILFFSFLRRKTQKFLCLL